MKYLLCLLLVGCTVHEVELQEAVIQTRGIPIVQVVIEGAGGDLVPVEYEMKTDSRISVHPLLFTGVMVFLFTVGIISAFQVLSNAYGRRK